MNRCPAWWKQLAGVSAKVRQLPAWLAKTCKISWSSKTAIVTLQNRGVRGSDTHCQFQSRAFGVYIPAVKPGIQTTPNSQTSHDTFLEKHNLRLAFSYTHENQSILSPASTACFWIRKDSQRFPTKFRSSQLGRQGSSSSSLSRGEPLASTFLIPYMNMVPGDMLPMEAKCQWLLRRRSPYGKVSTMVESVTGPGSH